MVGVATTLGQHILPTNDGHDDIGGAGIESGGWLIEEQNTRRRYQFHADVYPFSFTAGNSADKLVADLR